MSAREGTLVYDRQSGRYDIRFDIDSYYGGLHCGTSFEVLLNDVWIPTRIEFANGGAEGWYLVGLRKHTNDLRLNSLRVRL